MTHHDTELLRENLDPLFRVGVVSRTNDPQTTTWAAMHQDYSEGFVLDQESSWPSEEDCGLIAVKHLLKGGRGHYGPLEHAQIVFNVGWFPHSVMQQARTHRVGISFDVQSFRYTGKRVIDALEGRTDFEEVFYLRPLGDYTDRLGKKYAYTKEQRALDLKHCQASAKRYSELLNQGYAEEHARSILPFDTRQHFVVSFTLRSFLHFMDLRSKRDAQLEIRQLCDLMWPLFFEWTPQIALWYEDNRLNKARLSP